MEAVIRHPGNNPVTGPEITDLTTDPFRELVAVP